MRGEYPKTGLRADRGGNGTGRLAVRLGERGLPPARGGLPVGIVRSALRHLASAPGFTIVAVLSLTLGIGPTTAIFSLIDELLLRSLPVAQPEELVLLRVAARRPRSHEPRRRRAGRRRSGDRPRGRHAVVARHLRAAADDAGAGVRTSSPSASFSRVSVIADGVPETGDLGAVRLGRLLRRRRRDAGDRPADRASRRRPRRRRRSPCSRIATGSAASTAAPTRSGAPSRSTGCRRPSSACRRPASTAPSRSARPSTSRCRSPTTCCSSPTGPAAPTPGYWWLSVMARLAPGATAEQLRAALEPDVPGGGPRRLGVARARARRSPRRSAAARRARARRATTRPGARSGCR